MVSVADRGAALELRVVVEIVTTPGPIPVAPELIFTHVTGLDAIQLQPVLVSTVICRVDAAVGIVSAAGETAMEPSV
jgi:hypothetical protein